MCRKTHINHSLTHPLTHINSNEPQTTEEPMNNAKGSRADITLKFIVIIMNGIQM